VVSKRGVPEDALISIRSGSVRRQGAVSSEKPFRFPQNVSESDCVVKVDIMENIGSGYLVLRPNQTEGKQYEVVLGGESSDMACELEVKPADGGGKASDSPEDAAAAAKSKEDAKMYLESTSLLPFVQGVLQVIAKQRPADPFAAMAKHFLIASDEATSPTPGSPKSAPASPKKAIEASASREADEATKEAEGAPKVAEDAAAEAPAQADGQDQAEPATGGAENEEAAEEKKEGAE